MIAPLVVAAAFLGIGLIAGRAGRPAPPPLIIERRAALSNDQSEKVNDQGKANGQEEQSGGDKGTGPSDSEISTASNSSEAHPAPIEEAVYICGARTKKGTPCSRRVHGPVRCWQHKGMSAMLPQEKLAVKD